MQALNISLFQWIAAGQSPDAMLVRLASWIAVGASWACALVIGWAAWRQPPRRAYVVFTLVAAAAASLAAHAAAEAIDLPRPFMAGLSPNHINHGARGSLPSTHASVMFTAALMFLRHPALLGTGIALFAVAVITGWARIYVGVHYPFDIVAGLLLGAVVAGAFRLLMKVQPAIHRFVVARGMG
jgi:undecaprenyl-diphosphatase